MSMQMELMVLCVHCMLALHHANIWHIAGLMNHNVCPSFHRGDNAQTQLNTTFEVLCRFSKQCSQYRLQGVCCSSLVMSTHNSLEHLVA